MKITLSLLIALLFIGSLRAQNYKTASTSEEEYNYMSKGYSVQIESGLDMKKGYAIGKTASITENSYNFSFMPLLKVTGRDSVLTGTIVKATSQVSGKTYWFGIPERNDVLFVKCFQSIGNLDCSMKWAFFVAYARYKQGQY